MDVLLMLSKLFSNMTQVLAPIRLARLDAEGIEPPTRSV